jgi:hypothetical protein
MSSALMSQSSVRALPVLQTEWLQAPRSTVHEVWQLPLTQVPEQIEPQLPQFEVSLPIVSTQLDVQQLSVPPHGLPQLPQLFGSCDVSTHVLLQHVVPPRHCPLHGAVSGVPPLSFGGVPLSFGGVLLSGFVLESGFGPESTTALSSPVVPVAHAATTEAKNRQTNAARMATPS